MQYISLALAVIRLITSVVTMFQREQWVNEGARRVYAKQIKEINNALVRAAGIEKEWEELTEEEVRKRFENKGWFSD